MSYFEFEGQAWMEHLEKRITKVERRMRELVITRSEIMELREKLDGRIAKLEKGEQEVFAQERSKNLNEAYHMPGPLPPWVRGIRRIRKGEEAFRIERMRKEAEQAKASQAVWPAAPRANFTEPRRPERTCECCK